MRPRVNVRRLLSPAVALMALSLSLVACGDFLKDTYGKPTITEAKVATTAQAGSDLTMTATVEGPELKFSWLDQDGKTLTDCKDATTTCVIKAANAKAGKYTVKVENRWGSDSQEITVNGSVDPNPQVKVPTFKQQPGAVSVKQGAEAKFEVQVEGEGPLTYAWYFNGKPLPADQPSKFACGSNSCIVKNVQIADVGSYMVKVTNKGGTVESSPASLIMETFDSTALYYPSVTKANFAFIKQRALQENKLLIIEVTSNDPQACPNCAAITQALQTKNASDNANPQSPNKWIGGTITTKEESKDINEDFGLEPKSLPTVFVFHQAGTMTSNPISTPDVVNRYVDSLFKSSGF